MLGLDVKAKKDEIKAAYKEYVRTSHPDLKQGEDQQEFAVKFAKLTAEYDRVMAMSDDELWLESFDTGITRMATKRVDGVNLNPWERRFRQWAREKDLLVIDDLDDDADCRKTAKLYLDRCEVDPTLEECQDVEARMAAEEATSKASRPSAGGAGPSAPTSAMRAGTGGGEAMDPVFLALAFGGFGFLFFCELAYLMKAVSG